MTYTSFSFCILFVILFLAYFILPKKFQWACLLVASYAFYYFAAGASVLFYLVFTTVSIFLLGLWLGKMNDRKNAELKSYDGDDKSVKSAIRKKAKKGKLLALLIGLITNFGILAALKYGNFIADNISAVFNTRTLSMDLLLPLGISFYTFQATGYLVDVYREKFQPDRNIAKFALFVSFFPQIVQGPIGRYDQLADQLYARHDFDIRRIKFGLQLILWGLFKKMVIADRIAMMSSYMLNHPHDYQGFEVAVLILAITFRIYADFSGGIDISIGIAQILGINLTQNFERPYFAVSIADHWRRWHITLGTWFRDYVYYPITLSKPFFAFSSWSRKHLGKQVGRLLPIALGTGISFFLVGVWHGAAWKFIAFGLYNSVIIMIGIIFTPLLKNLNERRRMVDTSKLSWRFFLIFITFILISIGKLITGAHSLSDAIYLFKSMFAEFNPWIFYDGTIYELGLTYPDFMLLIAALIVLFVVDLLHERGIQIREALDTQNLYFRWLISILAIFSIIIFGVYGSGVAHDFIYQQF